MVALSGDLLETYQPILPAVNSGGYIPAVYGRSRFAETRQVERLMAHHLDVGRSGLGGDSGTSTDGPLCVGRTASNIAVWQRACGAV